MYSYSVEIFLRPGDYVSFSVGKMDAVSGGLGSFVPSGAVVGSLSPAALVVSYTLTGRPAAVGQEEEEVLLIYGLLIIINNINKGINKYYASTIRSVGLTRF
ncbi:hypothetical protein AVEN_163153-1 [Araneus ventricosus]|uniref:Uncharacterized protein n=1 Tax=Araneus ventricosus TaxID=182803 RepID=A0A4Y2DJD8_ARAVE|nr:hypothetical protein AVEN_163153-1 [Araneus ventricosus]